MGDFYNPPSASVAFIDLATFSELEGFLYGGPMASTWFVAGIIKSNWFSMVSVPLRSIGVAPIFGARRCSYQITRQADYALNSTLRAKFPALGFKSTVVGAATVRWVNNLMHNLVQHVQLEFNDLTVEEFDSWWLDVNFEFRCPGSKRVGYEQMIGNGRGDFILPVVNPDFLPGGTLTLPLPFFYAEDSGFSIPVAALPFNDIKLTFDFRDWKQLVMIDPLASGATINDITSYVNGVVDDALAPALSNVEVWTHYAVVHQDERSKMGEAPRDLAMTQVQTIHATPFKDITSRTSFDIRQAHAIRSFFFLAQNVSLQNTFNGTFGYEQSNYTTLSEVLAGSASYRPFDPLAFATLTYENQSRMSDSTIYYSLEVPWYWSDAIPETTGYHAGSYALKMWTSCHPAGSTDYSKLANVSISYNATPAARSAAAGLYPDGSIITFDTASPWEQQWVHIFMSNSWNIVRVSHGSLGFPAL